MRMRVREKRKGEEEGEREKRNENPREDMSKVEPKEEEREVRSNIPKDRLQCRGRGKAGKNEITETTRAREGLKSIEVDIQGERERLQCIKEKEGIDETNKTTNFDKRETNEGSTNECIRERRITRNRKEEEGKD